MAFLGVLVNMHARAVSKRSGHLGFAREQVKELPVVLDGVPDDPNVAEGDDDQRKDPGEEEHEYDEAPVAPVGGYAVDGACCQVALE